MSDNIPPDAPYSTSYKVKLVNHLGKVQEKTLIQAIKEGQQSVIP